MKADANTRARLRALRKKYGLGEFSKRKGIRSRLGARARSYAKTKYPKGYRKRKVKPGLGTFYKNPKSGPPIPPPTAILDDSLVGPRGGPFGAGNRLYPGAPIPGTFNLGILPGNIGYIP